MTNLTKEFIKSHIADSSIIYQRGEKIYSLGTYYLKEADFNNNVFYYYFDGNYGDYDVHITIENNVELTGVELTIWLPIVVQTKDAE